jgi:hypothetical protein
MNFRTRISCVAADLAWLKMDRKQDVSSGKSNPTNERKHKEGTLSSNYSKEWTKTDTNYHKMIKSILVSA